MKLSIELKMEEGIELNLKITILFLLLCVNLLNASNIIKIDYSSVNIEKFNLSYLLDKKNALSVEKLHTMKFKQTSNKHSFGNTPATLWIKLAIKNETDIKRKIFLHDNFAYFSKKITLYEYVHGKLQDQNIYNILEKESNKLTGSVLVYPLTLKPQTTTTLFIKIVPVVTQIVDLNLYDEKNHLRALINKQFVSNIIVIIMFALALYNIFLYLFNRKKEFIYYSLYLINAAIGLSYMYGTLFHNFNMYGKNVYWVNITAILVSLFLALFIQSLFNFKNTNKLAHKLLNSIIYIVLLDTAFAIFVDLQYALIFLTVITAYTAGVIIYIAVVLYKRKHPLCKIFIFAYTIFIVSFMLTLLVILGVVTLNTFTFYSSGVGLILEALLFSYLIYYQIKYLEEQITKQQNTLILKNQKEQMGEMIGAITHQWKQPLTSLSSIITLLHFKMKAKKDIDLNLLDAKLIQMDKQVEFLVETANDFQNFFNAKKSKTDCDLSKLIQRAISLHKDDLLAEEIIIKQDLQFTKNVDIFENELLHILLNIIQNAKEAFKDKNTQNGEVKMIKIIGTTNVNNTIIDIIDNAGGIKEEKLPFIFQENYSSKKTGSGRGFGLYLSKIIIEKHMNGEILAKNVGNGTLFRITL